MGLVLCKDAAVAAEQRGRGFNRTRLPKNPRASALNRDTSPSRRKKWEKISSVLCHPLLPTIRSSRFLSVWSEGSQVIMARLLIYGLLLFNGLLLNVRSIQGNANLWLVLIWRAILKMASHTLLFRLEIAGLELLTKLEKEKTRMFVFFSFW